MKLFFVFVIALTGAACTPENPVTQQKMLVLSKDRYQVNGATTNFADAMSKLGPPDETRVELIVCPNLKYAILKDTKQALEKAGYDKFILAHVEVNDLALCPAER